METNEQQKFYVPAWLVISLGVLLMLLVVLMIVQKGNDLKNTISNTKPANTISVSGEGKIQATPDLATVSMGVFSQGSDPATLKNQNNTSVNKITAFLKAQGVDSKDITTTNYSLQPQYNYINGQQTVSGYQANQTVTVKVHGVDKDTTLLDKIIEGAVNNGANEVDGVNLSIENPDALQQQAQQQAIDNAKSKAQKLAQEAGLTLGKVVSVAESSNGYPGPIPFATNMAMSAGVVGKSVAPDIQTGSQEVDETMTITYEVK